LSVVDLHRTAGAVTGSLGEIVTRVQEAADDRAGHFRWDAYAGARTTSNDSPPPRRAPLRVLLSDHRETLFRRLHDPRVEVRELADADSVTPDVLVVTRADLLKLEESTKDVAPAVWTGVASGATRVVLDASGEGYPQKAARTAIHHAFLASKGLDLTRAAYITQDRGYFDHYAAHCTSRGLGAKRMQILVYDRFIQATFAPLHDGGEEIYHERLGLYAARAKHRARRFVCLNNTVRSQRALLLMRLLRDGLWDRGFISVGPLRQRWHRVLGEADFTQALQSLPGFEDMALELTPWLDELEARAPIWIGGEPSDASAPAMRRLLDPSAFAEYQQSWFSVVTESDFGDRLRRITEKAFKALLNFHPLIVLGGPGSLRLLRAYGFETYPGLFDETYDDVSDPRLRFEMIYEQLAQLCRTDEAELAAREEAVAETVIFNAYWGLTQLPKVFRSHIDSHLVDQLTWFVEGRAKPSP